MSVEGPEIARRRAVALAAIKQGLRDQGVASEVGLFVSHHLDELDESYWRGHFGTPRPEIEQVIELIKLKEHWSGEADLDKFDFTLPGDVTDYVISVSFDAAGEVHDIAMES